MRCTTPISTISYNSDSFLVETLNKLIDEHYIEFWAFIQHLPEEDERKAHKHLYVIPACLIDTMMLQSRLQELDINNPDLPPLGSIRFVRSKFADWYLYSLHDRDYLASKNEQRKFHYTKEEFVCSDPDYMSELVHTSDFSKYKVFANFRDSVKSGVSFKELFQNGFIPVQQIIQWKKAYNLMLFGDMDVDEKTFRGGRKGHENDSDGYVCEGDRGRACSDPSNVAPSESILNHYIDDVRSDGEIVNQLDLASYMSLPFDDKVGDDD